MSRVLLIAALAGLLAGGCGSRKAKVKGQLVENGKTLPFPAFQVSVQFSPVGPDGKVDGSKVYSAIVSEDGSFEVLESGGEMPVGTYQVAIQATGKLGPKYKTFASPGSPVRREIKAGMNNLTIDLTKPEG